ncbi:MAG: thiamine-phosphate kinase [Candidatus Aerophobetes bacterium]|nr:thiamine-phosphate kinase [Candidatus Aerophobetes bacterium]
MRLSQVGEFELIKQIRSNLPASQKEVVVGVGDDAALIRVSPQKFLLFTTDTLVENVHFKWDYTSPFQIGWKALAVNISDIAAMGGKPTYCLISLAISGDVEKSLVNELYKGLKKIASLYKIEITGGDLVYSPVFMVTICLLGEADKDNFVLRSGAKKGDLIYVTGDLGASKAGLVCLENLKKNRRKEAPFIKKHLMPYPKLKEGQQIAKNKLSNAMIDISDGLVSDLFHIAEESGVGAIIQEEKITLNPSVRKLAREIKASALNWALYGGEDYELLFTVPKDKKRMVEETLSFSPILIGEVVDKKEGISLIDTSGKRIELKGRGYDHFLKVDQINHSGKGVKNA